MRCSPSSIRCSKRSCMAFSFSRRSRLRQSTKVSSPSGEGQSFTSNPSRIVCQSAASSSRSNCLEHALGRAHDVPPSALLEEGDVVGRDHAPIADPDAIRPAVAPLHRLDDLLQRRHIRAISREDLVAQRHPALGDHQADADLFAVRPMVAGIAALRPADWRRPGPRSTCWSRRTAAGRTPGRTARPADSSRNASKASLCGSSASRAR